MSQFTKNEINDLLIKLTIKEISPDTIISGQYTNLTLLHAVILSDLSHNEIKILLKKFINLGCSVDVYAADTTPITLALNNGYIDFALYMLEYHTFGDKSDLDILKVLSSRTNNILFTEFIASGKIDTNVTRYKGSHILHHLADTESFAGFIYTIWEYAPNTNPNPIHRKGYSPLTHALNYDALDCAKALASNPNSKIIGTLENPYAVIDTETIDRYIGDFWKDFEKDNVVKYAIENNKEHLIPALIRDVFLF